jgi:hypothetical protein
MKMRITLLAVVMVGAIVLALVLGDSPWPEL